MFFLGEKRAGRHVECPRQHQPAGPYIPMESDIHLPGAVALGGASPAHGPRDAPYHIKFPGRGISRPRKELV